MRTLRSPLALASAAVIAVLIGLAGWTELNHAASLSTGSDMDAYWNAAVRLRGGDVSSIDFDLPIWPLSDSRARQRR